LVKSPANLRPIKTISTPWRAPTQISTGRVLSIFSPKGRPNHLAYRFRYVEPVSGRSCEIASRRQRSIDQLTDRRKAGTAIHCGIGPDNVQRRITYGNLRRKATSRTFEAFSDFSKPFQIFQVSSGLCKSPQNHHRAPRQGGGESRLRKNSVRRLNHPPVTRTVLLEFTFLGLTEPNRRRSKLPSEERSVLHCTASCEVPEPGKSPLYRVTETRCLSSIKRKGKTIEKI
jgi:hypothetical protein